MRRSTPARGALNTSAPFTSTDWKTVFVDHLSFEVADYRRSTAFYEALLGWQVRREIVGPAWPDSPKSFTLRSCDVAGAIIRHARNVTAYAVSARLGHICFCI